MLNPVAQLIIQTFNTLDKNSQEQVLEIITQQQSSKTKPYKQKKYDINLLANEILMAHRKKHLVQNHKHSGCVE